METDSYEGFEPSTTLASGSDRQGRAHPRLNNNKDNNNNNNNNNNNKGMTSNMIREPSAH